MIILVSHKDCGSHKIKQAYQILTAHVLIRGVGRRLITIVLLKFLPVLKSSSGSGQLDPQGQGANDIR
jgi:hypothetical protein